MKSKDQQIDEVVAELLRRRDEGEFVAHDWILAEHGELQPELGDALDLLTALAVAKVRTSRVAASRPVRLLTDEELDLPIGLCPSDNCAPAAGAIQIGGYTITREIDRGGQAAVYEALQRSTGRRVAVKVLAGGRFASDRSRARFEREAAILARLDHPGVVCILDKGQTGDGFFYIVMPLVDGPTLGECLLGEPLGLRGICSLFGKICRAIEAAHQLGILHRDMKPSNIRVDRYGHPRVLDFGLAQLLHDETDQAATITADLHVVGSAPYSSPEQVSGSRELDGRTDIYSIGTMLFEAFAGRPPFPHTLPLNEIFRHILTVDPPKPSTFRESRCPDDAAIDKVVARCLAKSADYRYATAANLAEDLEAVAQGRPIARSPLAPRRVSTFASIGILFAIAAVTLGTALRRTSASDVGERAGPILLPSFRNSVDMTLIRVPIGSLMVMGSGETRIDHAFWLSSTEVTRDAYLRLMPPHADALPSDAPIDNVSWFDSVEFCRRLSTREHKHYRLPTPAEWEYACRSGGRLIGSEANGLNEFAWSSANSGGRAHPVELLRPNSWGFYDMLGNVGEWCDAPKADISAPVIGGSFVSKPRFCNPNSSRFLPRTFKSSDVGLRIAADE